MPGDEDPRTIARRIVEQVLTEHGERRRPPAGAGAPAADRRARPDTPAWRVARRLVAEVLAEHERHDQAPDPPADAVPSAPIPPDPVPPPVPPDPQPPAPDPEPTPEPVPEPPVPDPQPVPDPVPPPTPEPEPPEPEPARHAAPVDPPTLGDEPAPALADGPATDGEVLVDVDLAGPPRTGRWLLTTVVGAVVLALLFPLAVAAVRDLVSLS